jgi:hypothetical protein
VKASTDATPAGAKFVAAVQGPDTDGTERVDIFYQPVGMAGHFTSTATEFDKFCSDDNPPSGGIATVVLNEEGKLKRRNAKYSEANLSE